MSKRLSDVVEQHSKFIVKRSPYGDSSSYEDDSNETNSDSSYDSSEIRSKKTTTTQAPNPHPNPNPKSKQHHKRHGKKVKQG
ncbi:uncharacterized protein LOC127278160 isoform X6 [Leptopilina boulardi]|uniref:uncharacterized protein LOC127278160 isoform X4 n=1 Tax=Leptopilina boulardi TaxID=63433 RepID=UPI0021F69978|nr:uncharacterized protein LOC127278160 isoform X4 [Leptopilina boulardi]XP_051155692.1 uncharacterized protein LOC127278160 isoform X5 [Leptopilina boulardi]XP_051155693.1 uncharacterized protein LOC127278160 isoform X6 [Leptopilina boulardi]